MYIDSILDNSNEEIQNDLIRLLPLIFPQTHIRNKKTRLMQFYDKVYHYSDEVKFFHYSGTNGSVKLLSDGQDYPITASGFSLESKELALIKFVGEAVERFSQRIYRNKDLITGTYDNFRDKAVDIMKISGISDHQRQKPFFHRFIYDNNSEFKWTYGNDLRTGKKVLIPAQLIYFNYKFKKEKIIYIPTTTGTAGGSSLAMAIYRAILELIERDHFLIAYLNKLNPPRIDLKSIKDIKVKNVIHKVLEHKFDLSIIDLTLDFGIPTFLSIVIDNTGIGSAVSLGLRSDLDPNTAIIGAISETLHPRCWIRRIAEDNPELLNKVNPQLIFSLKDRALYWYPKNKIRDIDFFLKGREMKIQDNKNIFGLSDRNKLLLLLEKLKDKDIDIYYKDVSLPEIIKMGYHVVKVVIPQTVPFYLDERFPYLGAKRLYTVPKELGFQRDLSTEDDLNKMPHPFL